MHHADTPGDGVGWAGDAHLITVEQDLTLVRRGQAVQDVHERRLARAVLSQQRVDLPRAHVEVDVVVGDHAGIALGDAAHLERGRDDLGHAPGLARSEGASIAVRFLGRNVERRARLEPGSPS